MSYSGEWRSLYYPEIRGTISFYFDNIDNTEKEVDALFTYEGVFKRGTKEQIKLKIHPARRSMCYDQVQFQIQRFDDIIGGTYKSSFPPDQGAFLLSKAGIERPSLDQHIQANGGCVLM